MKVRLVEGPDKNGIPKINSNISKRAKNINKNLICCTSNRTNIIPVASKSYIHSRTKIVEDAAPRKNVTNAKPQSYNIFNGINITTNNIVGINP